MNLILTYPISITSSDDEFITNADDEADETFDIAEDDHDSQNFHSMNDSQAWMDDKSLT